MSQEAEDYGALVEALKSLQAKRQPIEDRLRAIDERKGTTAPHIYEKVRKETLEKLDGLGREASGLQAEARDALGGITAEKARITEALARINEELEEVRFRNSLGEFPAEEFERLESEKKGELDAAQAKVQPLLEAESVLDQFLHHPSTAAEPAAAAAPAAPSPAPAAPAGNAAASRPAAEMEALFGSGSFPAAPRPAPAPSPSRTDPTVIPPAAGEPGQPPPARPFERRTTAAYPALVPEETTEDLGMRPYGGRKAFPSASPAAPRPVLIVKTRDKDRGEDSYDLQPGNTLIGRAPENDVILLEESVSRRHARIAVEGSECTIEDLGSANGSYVNGERLRPKQPRKLQDNDVVKLGQLLALFRMNPDD